MTATLAGTSALRSASTAAAPAASACGTKARPSLLVPGTATNSSPGLILRLSAAIPESSSPAKRGSKRAPSSGKSASFMDSFVTRNCGRRKPLPAFRRVGQDRLVGLGQIEARFDVEQRRDPGNDLAGDRPGVPA